MLATIAVAHIAVIGLAGHIVLAMLRLGLAVVKHIDGGYRRLHGGKRHHEGQQQDPQIVIGFTSHRYSALSGLFVKSIAHSAVYANSSRRISDADTHYPHSITVKPAGVMADKSTTKQLFDPGPRGEVQEYMKQSSKQQSLRQKVSETKELPAMPSISQKLIELRDNPDADIQSLANIISMDPGLTGKLIRYATSPFFGFGGRIDSIENAISNVLGFDKALHMALAFDTSNAFQLPTQGPIGLQAIWRQSLFCAALTQKLANDVAPASQPSAGMMYMAGLLHNIGYLLLGHLFREEFNLLNKTVQENPRIPLLVLEERVLGLAHADIGVWLMREWSMPAELIVATFEHHNPNYRGQHFVYPNLILIANRLLKRHGIGDESETVSPPAMLTKLGLDEATVAGALEAVMENRDAIETMVQELHA